MIQEFDQQESTIIRVNVWLSKMNLEYITFPRKVKPFPNTVDDMLYFFKENANLYRKFIESNGKLFCLYNAKVFYTYLTVKCVII